MNDFTGFWTFNYEIIKNSCWALIDRYLTK